MSTSGPDTCLTIVPDSAVVCCAGPGSWGEGRSWAGGCFLPLLARWSHTSFGTFAVTTLGLVDTRVWHTWARRVLIGTHLMNI